MKKKLAMILLGCALTASALTGCAGSSNEQTETKVEATNENDKGITDSKDTKDAEEEKKADADYASWTGKEWAAASEEERAKAAKYYLVETTKATVKASGAEYTDEMEDSILTEEAVSATISALDMGFGTSEEIKISDLIKTATSAADSILNQTPEAEEQ